MFQLNEEIYICKVTIDTYNEIMRKYTSHYDGFAVLKKSGKNYCLLEMQNNIRNVSASHFLQYTSKTAVPNSSKVLINGKSVALEAYNIDGNNYFKLRDLAASLSDTNAAFTVEWDSNKNAINLQKGINYMGTISAVMSKRNQQAVESINPLYIDDELVFVAAYNINGNTYFKLRDLGKLTGFTVGFDSGSNTVTIETK